MLLDHDIVFLALCRVAFPKCSAAQINTFLYRINYGDVTFRFYTAPQITKAETRLGLTRKGGCTTAYQAYLPINLLKRRMYWNLPYPFGIADIDAAAAAAAAAAEKSGERKESAIVGCCAATTTLSETLVKSGSW